MEDRFTIFYNHTIYPELARLELNRRRLMLLTALSLVIGIFILYAFVQSGVFLVFLLAGIIFVGYIAFLGIQIRKYIINYKPSVIRLILDYIDNQPLYGDLSYEPKQGWTPDDIQMSRLFQAKWSTFKSEDFITGRIGDVHFELAELRTASPNAVTQRAELFFEGVVCKTTFATNQHQEVLIYPRSWRSRQVALTKSVMQKGLAPSKLDPETAFGKHFLMYNTRRKRNHVFTIPKIQQTIMDYVDNTNLDVMLHLKDQVAWIAIETKKDGLEPNIWRSNLRFQPISEFHHDLNTIFTLIQEIDKYF